MRHIKRMAAITIAMVTGVVLIEPVAAFAAPPSNDTIANVEAVATVPFSVTVNTTEATTDAEDAAANVECGAPATDASVWYSVTPDVDAAYVVDVGGSSYTAGVLVLTGSPGRLAIVTCGPEAVVFEATAATTYYLLVIDDQADGAGNGGTLRLSITEADPPPTVDLTVKATGTFDRQGVATVSGTITCAGVVEFSLIGVELRQPVGRGIVVGFSDFEVVCDDVVRPWTTQVPPFYPGTKFGGGKAVAMTFGVACGPIFCGDDYVERTVRLKRAR